MAKGTGRLSTFYISAIYRMNWKPDSSWVPKNLYRISTRNSVFVSLFLWFLYGQKPNGFYGQNGYNPKMTCKLICKLQTTIVYSYTYLCILHNVCKTKNFCLIKVLHLWIHWVNGIPSFYAKLLNISWILDLLNINLNFNYQSSALYPKVLDVCYW